MQGLILMELREFALRKLPAGSWDRMLASCGLAGKAYGLGEYPDSEVMALVGAAAGIAGIPASEVLERFGEFIVPSLVNGFKPFIHPRWKTLDLLMNTEKTIHRAVRISDATAKPPAINAVKQAEDTVLITYSSVRRLCSLAKGIIRGVAAHYGEQVNVEERRCMHRGDAACEIKVHLEPPPLLPVF